MEFYLRPLWVKVGYAYVGGGSLRLLERAVLLFSKGSSVEDDPILLNVVNFTRNKLF